MAKKDSERCITALLESGADSGIKNKDGRTPYALASASCGLRVQRGSGVLARFASSQGPFASSHPGLFVFLRYFQCTRRKRPRPS